MDSWWPAIARRIAEGLGIEPGNLVVVRDHTARPDALVETLLAIEERGGTHLTELVTADYFERLLRNAPLPHLADWDRHRVEWVRAADRVLVLEGEQFSVAGASAEALAAWQASVARLTEAEEKSPRPNPLVAVPTAGRALALGLTLPDLEAIVLPALATESSVLRREIDAMRTAVEGSRTLTIRSGSGCELHLDRGDRLWLEDDGVIDAADRARGAVVSNLPAGSIYTTVVEDRTEGSLHLPSVGDAEGVSLRFERGRVAEVSGGSGATEVRDLLDRHTGDAGRVSHVGVGLNPDLRRPVGWTLVDEHVHGCLFGALGENRYMGGQNASSLNVDYAIPSATLLADDRVVVRDGVVVVSGSDLATDQTVRG